MKKNKKILIKKKLYRYNCPICERLVKTENEYQYLCDFQDCKNIFRDYENIQKRNIVNNLKKEIIYVDEKTNSPEIFYLSKNYKKNLKKYYKENKDYLKEKRRLRYKFDSGKINKNDYNKLVIELKNKYNKLI